MSYFDQMNSGSARAWTLRLLALAPVPLRRELIETIQANQVDDLIAATSRALTSTQPFDELEMHAPALQTAMMETCSNVRASSFLALVLFGVWRVLRSAGNEQDLVQNILPPDAAGNLLGLDLPSMLRADPRGHTGRADNVGFYLFSHDGSADMAGRLLRSMSEQRVAASISNAVSTGSAEGTPSDNGITIGEAYASSNPTRE